MKRTIKLAVAAAVALTSTAAFATNGDNLIAVGAKARGMGGVGIGMSHGAESALSNPAMITTVKGTEISFGGTVFMPNVETDMGTGGGSLKSAADLSVIPEVAIAQKVSDNLTWGIGMFGTAGMGVDYRDGLNSYNSTAVATQMRVIYGAYGAQAAQGYVMSELAKGNFNMVTNLQLMQFAVPLAYKAAGFSVGIAPVLQYGSLDINYNLADASANLISGNTKGVAQDFGFGYNLGLGYTESGLTVGATYKSAIDMVYKGQISQAMKDFTGTLGSDHLEQPAEIGLGTSYTFSGNTVALDYKRVNWASAKGYKDFGWEDQDVYALGYQYAQDAWALRAGYNYAKSAIKSNVNTTLNTLNLLGFPATVEKHYTMGGSYGFSKSTSVDLAYVYASAKNQAYSNMLMATTTTKHNQDAVSVQLNLNF